MRNRDGMLTVESLEAGEREQFGIIRGGRRHVVTLGLPPGVKRDSRPYPFVVTHSVWDGKILVQHHRWRYQYVDDARFEFKVRVRKHTS